MEHAALWALLGIGPTHDLVAIKRAYALRLKVTRPDDDAEAYQALRQAYEFAQHWARHALSSAQEAQPASAADGAAESSDGAVPSSATTVATQAVLEAAPRALAPAEAPEQPLSPPRPSSADVDASNVPPAREAAGVDAPHVVAQAEAAAIHAVPVPSTAPEASAPPSDDLSARAAKAQTAGGDASHAGNTSAAPAEVPLTPEELVRQCYELWRARGDEVLVSAWPRLESVLSEMPLAWGPELSARFADLVIAVKTLPSEFVQRLQAHFGWLGDFRIDRVIGPARAEALRQVLAEVVIRPVTDPEVLRVMSGVRGLHRLTQRPHRVHAWLHAALLGAPLQHLLNGVAPQLLRGLGIEPADRQQIQEAIDVGRRLRFAMVGLLMLLTCLAFRAHQILASPSALFTAIEAALPLFSLMLTCLFARGAALLIGSHATAFLGRVVARPAGIGQRLRSWRQSRHGPWIGAVLQLVVVGLSFGPDPGVDAMPWVLLLGAALTAAALALCWTTRADLGVVAVAAWAFGSLCLINATGTSSFERLLGAQAIAGLMTMLALLHFEERLPWQFKFSRWSWYLLFVVPRMLQQGAQHADSALSWLGAGLGLLVVTTLTLARFSRDGYQSALAPMALAGCAIFMQGRGAMQGSWLTAWLLALLGLMALQRGAEWLDQRLYGNAADAKAG